MTFDTVPTSCSVTFNGVSYTNGQEATGVTGGSYSLAANSCSGETFSSWSSTAGTVTSLTSASTSILVSSNGTVTGTYTTTPIGYTVTFDTMPTSCSVTFNGVSYSNGQQATGVTGGSYPLVANACSGETFSSWTSSAGTVTSLTAASTSIAVSASGTVTGTFTATSTSYTIAFDVVPSTCSLTFNGNPYSNGGQATGVAAGAYSLDAAACAGETFTSWSSTVGTVASLTSSSTMVTVSSSGTITATFAPTPPATYPVTFVETGLPSGTTWSVTLAGTPHTESSATIGTSEADGTYVFTVGTVTGYTANVTSGSVIVNGAAKQVEIGFTAQSPSTPGSTSPGGLSTTDLALIVGLIVAALLVLFFFIAARPHRHPSCLGEGTSRRDVLVGETGRQGTVLHQHDDRVPRRGRCARLRGRVRHRLRCNPVSSGTVEVKKDRRLVPVAFSRLTPKP